MFFDYDRIEFYDEETEEDRFDTIGDTSAGNALLTRQGVSSTMIGDISRFTDEERKELERARSMPYVYKETECLHSCLLFCNPFVTQCMI